MATCPKCNVELAKTWTDKRRHMRGRCATCNKIVYLGKVSDDGNNEIKEKTREKKAAAPARKAPAPAGGRAGSGAAQQPRTFVDRILSFLDTNF